MSAAPRIETTVVRGAEHAARPDIRPAGDRPVAGTRDDVLATLEAAGVPVTKLHGLDEPLLTTGQVAVVLRTTDRTIRTWSDAGKIEAIRTLGGRRLFPLSSVIAAMDRMIGRSSSAAFRAGHDGPTDGTR